MKTQFTPRSFLILTGGSLLASASAETDYWDSNDGADGSGNSADTGSAASLGIATWNWPLARRAG